SIAVSGACETAPLLMTLPTVPVPLVIADGSCGDNAPPVVSCLDGPLGGHSLYFAFQSVVDVNDTNPQTWHLSVRDTGGDVALYLLNSCATPSCADMNSGVRSSTYQDLSFAVTPGQKYIVAVNKSLEQFCDGSSLPKVLLQRDQCMDGVVENGE